MLSFKLLYFMRNMQAGMHECIFLYILYKNKIFIYILLSFFLMNFDITGNIIKQYMLMQNNPHIHRHKLKTKKSKNIFSVSKKYCRKNKKPKKWTFILKLQNKRKNYIKNKRRQQIYTIYKIFKFARTFSCTHIRYLQTHVSHTIVNLKCVW